MRSGWVWAVVLGLGLGEPAAATLIGDTVTGQLSDPFTTQLFSNSTAVVGPGDEFTGLKSVGTTGLLEYYGDLDSDTITIGVRHLTTTGLIFNANPFTFQFGSLDWAGATPIQDIVFDSAFPQELWPDAANPNAKWVGWGQDAAVPPAWSPSWDSSSKTFTVVATEGFTIPPGYDVWATFRIVPEPGSALLVGLGLAGALIRTRRQR